MKPGHWLTLGSAIAGCTAALGIYLATQDSPPGNSATQSGNDRGQTVSATKRQFTISSASKSRLARAAGTTAAKTTLESGTPTAEFRIHGKPPAERVADERAWFANAERIGEPSALVRDAVGGWFAVDAERIEREANRELENLRETLELNPSQQQQIFDILARNSPAWMPGMLTGGSHGVGLVSDGDNSSNQTRLGPSGQSGDNSNDAGAPQSVSLTDEVLAVLDFDQQQALVEEELNRRAWWEEILPQLLPPEFPVAAGADNPAASLPGDGDTKTYQGPTEMLEE